MIIAMTIRAAGSIGAQGVLLSDARPIMKSVIRSLIVGLALVAGCAVEADLSSTRQIAQAGGGGACTASLWGGSECDLVVVTPFRGGLTALTASRQFPLGSNPYQPVGSPIVLEEGRLSASATAGYTVRLNMSELRSVFRMVCHFPDGSVVTPICGTMMTYAFSGGGYMFLEVWGDPLAPNTVMPSISASYLYAPGAKVYTADAFAVHWESSTYIARRASWPATPPATLTPNPSGTRLDVAFPYWFAL